MAFRFKLASVLLVRESIEKREELALQRVQAEIARAQQRMAVLTERIDRNRIERDRVLSQSTPAHQLQAILAEMQAAIEAKRALLDSLAQLERDRAERMEAYRAAHADHQLLADMLVAQRTSHDHEQVRREQKTLDQVFAAKSPRS
jgi:flagellar export protein FliJ